MTDGNDDVAIEPPTGVGPRWARSIEAAAIAGVVFAMLAIVGISLMLNLTDVVDSGGDGAEWLQEPANRTQQVIALNLIALSSIAFMWFTAVIRRRIGEREDRFFGTVFLASGITFVAVWLAGASAISAPAVALTYFDDAAMEPSTVTYATGLGAGFLWVVLPRVTGLLVLSTATIIRRTNALPTWLAIISVAVGVGLLVVPLFAGPIGFVFPIWVLIVSLTMLIRREQAHP